MFENGSHGSTILFLDPTSKYTMNAPYDFIIAPYNNIEGTNKLLEALPKDSLAAILVEPMQVSGGCIPGDATFLQHLRDLATANEALLIVDEIMTSRLDYGGLQVTLGIKPDITTIGKWAGRGMSFGAFVARREIMEWFDPRHGKLSHAGTFNNNIMTMAAGVAGSNFMSKESNFMSKERLSKLNEFGSRLRRDINVTIVERLTANGSHEAKYSPLAVAVCLQSASGGPRA